MPRRPKPFFRKQTKSWYFSTGGKQIPLGKDREAAFERFHELMADRQAIPTQSFTVYDLAQKYLDWVETNRSRGTYVHARTFLKSLVAAVGKRIKPTSLKQSTVTRWLQSTDLSSTSQAGAIAVVQRMFNWAVENDYLAANPIAGMKKPRRRRRDVVYTAEQWRTIRSHVNDEFGDVLDFMVQTGCRPQEVRAIEARHVHGDTVIFPAAESKGEDGRVLFLVKEAEEIVARLSNASPDGPIFRNTEGKPWTANAVRCRMKRLSEKVGFRVIAYGIRHTFATIALMNNVDPISVAHLMGHKNTRMVSEVYSHLAKNPEFLRQQAVKSVASATAETA